MYRAAGGQGLKNVSPSHVYNLRRKKEMYGHAEIAEVLNFEHGMKVIERTFEKRLRNVVKLNDM